VKFYATVASFSEGSPSFILLTTGILERSDTSLSRTIHLFCCRTQTCIVHTQSLSPRSRIGPYHQLYAALSGLTSKGRKRDKEVARVFLCSSNRVISRYLHQVPNPKLSNQLGTTWSPRAPSPQPTPVQGRCKNFLSSHLNDCNRINEVDGASLL
jgi:hypothetical protein